MLLDACTGIPVHRGLRAAAICATFVNEAEADQPEFFYNAFGDLRKEIDGAGAETTYVFDALGRVRQQTDSDGTTTFIWDNSLNGLGRLAESQSPAGVRTQFLYDAHGRPARELWTIEGELFEVDLTYDAHGRVATIAYPQNPGSTRFVARNIFDSNSGRLKTVLKDGTSKVYWELRNTTPEGKIAREEFGNQVEALRTYTALTGRLESQTMVRSGFTLQSLGYAYWADGNLLRRSDLLTSQHERFEYDKLDRIKRWMMADSSGEAASGGWEVNYGYDDFGNLTSRNFTPGTSTGGTAQNLQFHYEQVRNAGPHAVTAGPWGDYGYDLNGNQTQRPGDESIEYTAFNLPRRITGGATQVNFRYDALGRRAVKWKSATEYTAYVGRLYEKRTTSGSTADHVFFISGPEGPVAQVVRPVVVTMAGTEKTLYLHTDRLASVRSITDDDGQVLEVTKYDPFGNRVFDFNQPVLPPVPDTGSSPNGVTRGFTGHEMDFELGLINMQGRMYDPRLGRFLSADPVVQAPFDGRAYNRYAYVFNNPMKFTDPLGFEAGAANAQCPPGFKMFDGECRNAEELEETRKALEAAGYGLDCSGDECVLIGAAEEVRIGQEADYGDLDLHDDSIDEEPVATTGGGDAPQPPAGKNPENPPGSAPSSNGATGPNGQGNQGQPPKAPKPSGSNRGPINLRALAMAVGWGLLTPTSTPFTYRLSESFARELGGYFKAHFDYDVRTATFQLLAPLDQSASGQYDILRNGLSH
jgi:RHS repeat-associated protein